MSRLLHALAAVTIALPPITWKYPFLTSTPIKQGQKAMPGELSIELREYLKRCGLSENKIAQCNGRTRLYHDLGIYGEIAEAYMEVLTEHYHVDLSKFEFGKFFPHEFAGSNSLTRALLWVVPFAGNTARQCGEWLPLTLERIERAIHNKRLE